MVGHISKLVVAVLCVVISVQEVHGAVLSCDQVVSYLSPCVSYVLQGGGVPPNCCSGIRTLNGLAQTTVNRRAVCRCLKSAVSGFSYSSNNLNNAATLPAKCGVNLPYNISPSTSCDSIS